MKSSSEIESHGFAILSPCVTEDSMSRVTEEVTRRCPERRKGGVRHAMQFGAVRAIAQYQPLKQLVDEVALGRFLFGQPCSTRPPRRIGLWSGIRIRPYRYASGSRSPGGRLVDKKRGSRMRTLPPKCCLRFWHCEFTSMIPWRRMDPSGYCREHIGWEYEATIASSNSHNGSQRSIACCERRGHSHAAAACARIIEVHL